MGGVAIDVFENEPNTGKLVEKDSLLLAAYMGLRSIDCRSQMEIEETKEVINFLKGYPLKRKVPLEREVPQLGFEMQG